MEINQKYRANVPVEKLKPHPENPRNHALLDIENSIEQNGWYGAILVQASTNFVLAGHGSLQAAINRGAETVPAIFLEVDDETAKRVLLSDNRIADLSGYDQEKVEALLGSLESLEGTGYEDIAASDGGEAGEGDEGDGEVPDDLEKHEYGVIVLCEGEQEQEHVYNELKKAYPAERLRVVAI